MEIYMEKDYESFRMTVEDFYRVFHKFGNRIEIKSSFDGKIICKNYVTTRANKRKVSSIGEREVITIEAGFYTEENLFGVYPKIILWVEGSKEEK